MMIPENLIHPKYNELRKLLPAHVHLFRQFFRRIFMSLMIESDQLAFVTCSYQPDFERCARLCASMNIFISPDVAQFLIVPDRDRALFAQLESVGRTVISSEEVLPARFIQVPLLNKWWFDNAMWPVRGWVMQQITKLCADVVTNCENIVFVDSDVEFIRPLQHERFITEGALRLHRKPMHKSDGVHLKWHHGAGELLDLKPQYFGSDYVAPLVTWRRSNLVQMKRYIEDCKQRPWYEAVGRRMTVSEYTLYGVFVEHILGIEQSGHFKQAEDLCHSLWFEDEIEAFFAEFDDTNFPQAVHLQSNIGMKQADVNSLMGQLRQNVAPPQL
ncbi:MAG: hypothetical protein ACI9GB_003734 [Halioglobus sp.]|jgi:hypothetical protein